MDSEIRKEVSFKSAKCKSILLKVTDLCRQFDQKQVLSNLNFTIHPNTINAIYGTKSSGKTTLLKILVGLLEPTHGSVIYNLPAIKKSPSSVVIRYLPQQITLFTSCSLMENVKYFSKLYNLSPNAAIHSYLRIITAIHLTKVDTKIEEMTRNQMNTINFFIAVMGKPDILIMDEMGARTDSRFKEFMWGEMRRLSQKITFILTTYETGECLKADHFYYLRNGSIILNEIPRKVWLEHDKKSLLKVLGYAAEENGRYLTFREIKQHDNHEVRASERIDDKKRMKADFKLMMESKASPFVIIWILLDARFWVLTKSFLYHLVCLVIFPCLVLLIFHNGVHQEITNARIGFYECQACASADYEERHVNMLSQYCITMEEFKANFPRVFLYKNVSKMKEDLLAVGLRVTISYLHREADKKIVEEMEMLCEGKLLEKPLHRTHFIPIQIRIDSTVGPLGRKVNSVVDQIMRRLKDTLAPGHRRSLHQRLPAIDPFEELLTIDSRFLKATDDTDFIDWGILVIITFSLGVMVGVTPLLKIVSSGLRDRLMTSGIGFWHLEASRIFDSTMLLVVEAFLVLFTASLGSVKFNSFLVFFLLFVLSINGMVLGICFALITTQDRWIRRVVSMINILTFILSGAVWSRETFSDSMFNFGKFFPHTYVIEAVHAVVFEEQGWQSEVVGMGIRVPLGATIALYALYLLALYREGVYLAYLNSLVKIQKTWKGHNE